MGSPSLLLLATVLSCASGGHLSYHRKLLPSSRDHNLHSASSYPGAQFYIECTQIRVSGGGGKTPSGVSFSEAYKGTDQLSKFNIYYSTPTTYIVPGPTVFNC